MDDFIFYGAAAAVSLCVVVMGALWMMGAELAAREREPKPILRGSRNKRRGKNVS